jgi:NAD(P)-dependent dehydrogenase (short-subunit alcohol dehydrogenase family)
VTQRGQRPPAGAVPTLPCKLAAVTDQAKPELEKPAPLPSEALRGKIALVTGGAGGLGKAVAAALTAEDAVVVIADIDEELGQATADELDTHFIKLDVSDLDANKAAVAETVTKFGGLQLVHLNAGVASPFGLGDDFDHNAYRRAMSINLDGVVYGFHAARPALRASGGGSVIATASLAGLAAMAPQPVYGTNKHAVVGLVRALGPAHIGEGIHVNGICPGFADTAIIDDIRDGLIAGGMPIIAVETVAAATLQLFADDVSGRLLVIQAGVDPYYYRFPNIPRAR